jgi:hypothetical protein
MPKPMGDEYHRLAFPSLPQPFEELEFAPRVECAGRLVDTEELDLLRSESHKCPRADVSTGQSAAKNGEHQHLRYKPLFLSACS